MALHFFFLCKTVFNTFTDFVKPQHGPQARQDPRGHGSPHEATRLSEGNDERYRGRSRDIAPDLVRGVPEQGGRHVGDRRATYRGTHSRHSDEADETVDTQGAPSTSLR